MLRKIHAQHSHAWKAHVHHSHAVQWVWCVGCGVHVSFVIKNICVDVDGTTLFSVCFVCVKHRGKVQKLCARNASPLQMRCSAEGFAATYHVEVCLH